MNRLTKHARTGAAGIALVMILVFSQLTVVGVVIAGGRVQDTTTQRLDSVRSFYAAEAGINMSVREVMRGVDEDADGGTGTISNDNNANNDPLLVKARVCVSKANVSGNTQLVANARCGATKRKVDPRVQGGSGSSTQTVMITWGRSGSSTPYYSAWNGSTWSSASAMPTVGCNPVKWIRMKICPERNETMFVSEDECDDVNLVRYNGTSWATATEVSSDTGGTNDRPEDVAYEQDSADALSVYWKGTSSTFGYRTYNGTSFSSEGTISSPFGSECDYLTLAPRPATDQIVLLAVDGNSGGPLVSSYWNGSSFGSWTTLVSSLESNNEECYGMAFEAQTGKGVCVYIQSGTTTPRYRTLTGSTWSSQASLPDIGGVALWVRLAADPTTNKVIFAALDTNKDINTCVWNGTSWSAVTEVETNCSASDRRQFDVIFERTTGKALLVYVESGQNTPRYRTWNGSAWSAEASATNIGAQPEIIHLARGFGNGEIFAAISDSSRDLHVLRWSGTAWGADTEVETNLSGDVKQQSFSLPEPTVAPAPRLISWAEVEP